MNIFSVVLAAAGVVDILLALAAFKKKNSPAVLAFTGLMLSCAVYSIGYGIELSSQNLSGMLIAAKIQYLGIPFIPTFWILLSFEFTGFNFRNKKIFYGFLFAYSVVLSASALTTEYHHLFYKDFSVDYSRIIPLFSFHRGPIYNVDMIYKNLALFTCTVLFARSLFKIQPYYRKQTFLMLLGSIIPWITYIIYLLEINPWGLDLTSFALTVSALVFIYGLFNLQLFKIIPVARSSVFDGMKDAVIVFDTENQIIDFNPAALETIEKLSRESIGRPACAVLDDYPDLLKFVSASRKEEFELSIVKNGKSMYFSCRLSPVIRKKTTIGKTVVINNITKHIELLNQLEKLASTDSLTGINNRRNFIELCKRELSKAKRYSRPSSLIFMDIDHFKNVNDRFGHDAGDAALKNIVNLCLGSIRGSDIMGRLGGEEFALFLPDTDIHEAIILAEKLRCKIEANQIEYSSYNIAMTSSFGVFGTRHVNQFDIDLFLKKADLALYIAKENGRNRVET